MKRRTFNTVMLGAAGGLLTRAWTGFATESGKSTSGCSAVTAAQLSGRDLAAYIEAFNRSNFPAYERYYSEDLEFEGRGRHFRSRAEMTAFYRMVKSRMRETVSVRGAVVGRDSIAAELETELYALEDWPDFFSGPMKRGQTMRALSFVWYDIKNCKFSRIRSARYQLLDAPGSGRAPELDQSTPPPPTLTEEHFRAYIDAFNHGEQNKYGDYYTDDVVLVITGKKELRGRQAIFDFYKGVKSETQRTIQVNKVLSSGNRLAVELQSEFLALADVPDFIAGPMKKGGRIFVNTFVFYDLRDGKFARIRSAEFKKIPRP
jgi:ketosteroid isomerase-like protein